jgi:hypothetical protein
MVEKARGVAGVVMRWWKFETGLRDAGDDGGLFRAKN